MHGVTHLITGCACREPLVQTRPPIHPLARCMASGCCLDARPRGPAAPRTPRAAPQPHRVAASPGRAAAAAAAAVAGGQWQPGQPDDPPEALCGVQVRGRSSFLTAIRSHCNDDGLHMERSSKLQHSSARPHARTRAHREREREEREREREKGSRLTSTCVCALALLTIQIVHAWPCTRRLPWIATFNGETVEDSEGEAAAAVFEPVDAELMASLVRLRVVKRVVWTLLPTAAVGSEQRLGAGMPARGGKEPGSCPARPHAASTWERHTLCWVQTGRASQLQRALWPCSVQPSRHVRCSLRRCHLVRLTCW